MADLRLAVAVYMDTDRKDSAVTVAAESPDGKLRVVYHTEDPELGAAFMDALGVLCNKAIEIGFKPGPCPGHEVAGSRDEEGEEAA